MPRTCGAPMDHHRLQIIQEPLLPLASLPFVCTRDAGAPRHFILEHGGCALVGAGQRVRLEYFSGPLFGLPPSLGDPLLSVANCTRMVRVSGQLRDLLGKAEQGQKRQGIHKAEQSPRRGNE